MAGNSFAVNGLANLPDLALHFAGRPPPEARLVVDGRRGAAAAGTALWVHHRPWRSYHGGDHVLFLGEVQRYDTRNVAPLLFLGGQCRCRAGPNGI